MRFLSLFSGIEGASVALKPLGWECVAVAEVDPFGSAVIAQRHGVLNLGDVTTITEQQIQALRPLDAVIFGFPCQDLSVAGKRAGLKTKDGEQTRSGLFFDAMRIVRWAKCRWAVAENVPGLFSSNNGRDFASVVGEMAGVDLDVPDGGWANTGMAIGPEGLVEWCVLDAQFFGVPQRRRRIFIVRDSGDWRSRPPLLLEPESLQGDTPPSRKAGERVAPCLSQSLRSSGGIGMSDQELFSQKGGGLHWTEQIANCLQTTCDDYSRADGFNMVTHSLRADGFDASEDGTGRGTPLTVATLVSEGDAHSGFRDEHGRQVAFTLPAVHRGIGNAHNTNYQAQGMAVRRLTPRECERLQGFPDDYTNIQYRGKSAADGPRYKALGNSWAIPCVRWIGKRISAVEHKGDSI